MTRISAICNRNLKLDYDLQQKLTEALTNISCADTEFQILIPRVYSDEFFGQAVVNAVRIMRDTYPDKVIELIKVDYKICSSDSFATSSSPQFADINNRDSISFSNKKCYFTLFTATDERIAYWYDQLIQWVVYKADYLLIYAYDYLLTALEKKRLKAALIHFKEKAILLTSPVTYEKLLDEADKYPDKRAREIFLRINNGEAGIKVASDFNISAPRAYYIHRRVCGAIRTNLSVAKTTITGLNREFEELK